MANKKLSLQTHFAFTKWLKFYPKVQKFVPLCYFQSRRLQNGWDRGGILKDSVSEQEGEQERCEEKLKRKRDKINKYR